jgi:hypothetical protein
MTTFSDLIESIERRRQTLVVYSADEETVVDQFDARNATVESRRLPGDDPPGFVVIRDREGFVGSIGLAELSVLLEPPIYRPWSDEIDDAGYRALFELLDNTLFATLERRQLLAATREIENRAWRVGEGALHVGFERAGAIRQQAPVYDRLADETDLEIHVYWTGDEDVPELEDVAYHEGVDAVEDVWLVAYDGGGNDLDACALLAEERAPNEYYGFWTYDSEIVAEMFTQLRNGDG